MVLDRFSKAFGEVKFVFCSREDYNMCGSVMKVKSTRLGFCHSRFVQIYNAMNRQWMSKYMYVVIDFAIYFRAVRIFCEYFVFNSTCSPRGLGFVDETRLESVSLIFHFHYLSLNVPAE